jgi:hypothetical protein
MKGVEMYQRSKGSIKGMKAYQGSEGCIKGVKGVSMGVKDLSKE